MMKNIICKWIWKIGLDVKRVIKYYFNIEKMIKITEYEWNNNIKIFIEFIIYFEYFKYKINKQ
jgi:hypothetical protein